MAKPGRKKIIWKDEQWEQFEKLCGLQATKLEICAWFDISDKTLDRLVRHHYKKEFSEVFAEKRNIGRLSLRRAGFKMAMEHPAVHIFYAKNMLGMSDEYVHGLSFDIEIGGKKLNAENQDTKSE